MVFVRYVLKGSAIWQHEFVTFSLIGATFIGAPYVLLTRGHVNVDLLPLYLGPRGRLALGAARRADLARLLRHPRRLRLRLLVRGLVKDWHAETRLAAAALDPLRRRAARHGPARAAVRGRDPGAADRRAGAVRRPGGAAVSELQLGLADRRSSRSLVLLTGAPVAFSLGIVASASWSGPRACTRSASCPTSSTARSTASRCCRSRCSS